MDELKLDVHGVLIKGGNTAAHDASLYSVMVGLGPTIHEFLSARQRSSGQTRGWSCQARP